MSQKNLPHEYLPHAIWGLAVFCIMGGVFLHTQTSVQPTESVLAQALNVGIQRIQSTRFENIALQNFNVEEIDLNSDGSSLFETRRYDIAEDQPFTGLKTITVTVTWPDTSALVNEDAVPQMQSVMAVLIINKTQFS